MQNNYVYTKAGTDITIRWAKLYNYVPASEQAFYKKKWADFRAICNQSVEDIEPKAKQATFYQLETLNKEKKQQKPNLITDPELSKRFYINSDGNVGF